MKVSTIRRTMLAAAVSSAALAAGSGMASAQQFNRSVVFGDSLSDNGNLFATTGQPPAPYNRRFTNQLVWSEYLFGSATGVATLSPATVNAGNVNLAFGGARTDNAANSNGPIPGTGTQIALFLGNGGRFGANDVVSLWGGANNLFQALPGAAANPANAQAIMTASAASAAADVGAQVRQLAAAGARTILVYGLPDLGGTPQFGGTAAQSLSTFSSITFNAALAQQTAAAAAANPDANIITVDSAGLFDAIRQNPGAFGVANATQQCIQVAACVLGGTAAQNTFLFWDGVHPTATGHQIVAAAALEYLAAPSRAAVAGAALSDTAFALRRSAAVDALATLGRVNAAPGKTEFFVNLTGMTGQQDGTFRNGVLATAGSSSGRSHEFASGGVRLGVAHNFGNGWTVGGALYAQTGTIDGKRVNFSANNTQLGVDALARYAPGSGFFVNLGLGLNADSVTDFERRTVGPLFNTGTAMGTSFSAMLEVGQDYRMGSATITPVGRVGYIRTEFGQWNEAGAVAPVSHFARTVQAMTAAAELRGAVMLSPGVKLTAVVGYEGYIGAQADAVSGRLVSNSARPFSVNVRDPISPGFLFGLGAEAAVGTWTAQANYRGTLGERSHMTHSFSLGAKTSF
jgi:outer membrane lipase/esterase